MAYLDGQEILFSPQIYIGGKTPADQEAISNCANALKGTASGSAVSMTDVSPLEHQICVKLASDTVTDFSSVTLLKYGKNLFDLNSDLSSGTTQVIAGAKVFTANSSSRYLGIVITDAWKVADTANSKLRISFDIKLSKAGQFRVYTLGQKAINISAPEQYQNSGTEWAHFSVVGTIGTNTTGGDTCNLSFYGQTDGIIPSVKNIQIELGDTETEFEQFKKEGYLPETDGTVDGVTSLCPTTTLVTDTEGVTITAEYNKDLNKVVNDIYQKLSALGVAVVNN